MRITIENMPPIVSGSFELRPLTIFIGPNNTGKTRAGLLAYSFARALDAPFVSSAFPRVRELFVREPNSPLYDQADWQATLEDEFHAHVRDRENRALPELLSSLLAWVPTKALDGQAPRVRFEGKRNATLNVGPQADDKPADSAFITTEQNLIEWNEFLKRVAQRYVHPVDYQELPDEKFWKLVRSKLGFPVGAAHYLPSGRGAFAESWAFYTGLTLDRSPEGQSQFPLPAQVRDYLRLLLNASYLHVIAKGGDFGLDAAVDLIERGILDGRVTAAGNPSMPFPLIFSNIFDADENRFTIDLANASSSINELGPVAMILKTVVKHDDLLVIDEPEAHLHPENQRLIARALVRLAKSGVTVIAPTHSHTMIHEVSDVIRGGRLEKSKRDRLGYSEIEMITPTDVGVYVFRDQGAGVTIEEVEFDDEFGYPEETFFEVAQDQMMNSHRIDLASAPVTVE